MSASNTPWRASFKPSADALLHLIQALVFGVDYDEDILAWLRSRKSLADFFCLKAWSRLYTRSLRRRRKRRRWPWVEINHCKGLWKLWVKLPPLFHHHGETGVDGCSELKEFMSNMEANIDDPAEREQLLKKLERFKQQAATLVASYISLAEDTLSDGELLERIKQSAAGYASPDPSAKTHVLIYYSQHDGGEATAQPHLRVPPLRLRGQHAQRFVQMGLLRRGAVEGPDLVPGDVFIMTGKEGNKMPLMNAFALPPETEKGKPIPIAKKTVRQLSLMLSEKTIAQKMEKVRGYSSINQMQPLYVVSKLSLNLNLHLGHGYNI